MRAKYTVNRPWLIWIPVDRRAYNVWFCQHNCHMNIVYMWLIALQHKLSDVVHVGGKNLSGKRHVMKYEIVGFKYMDKEAL